jgi:hypothetical protein
MVELRDLMQKHGLTILVVLLVGYIGLRAFFQIRKAFAPASKPTTLRSPSEGLPPEEVADWLRNLPDHLAEDVDKPHPDENEVVR